MTWSTKRLAVGAILIAWAGLFWFLLASGRTSLFLSSRTAWVVPVGAVILTIAGIGRLASARSGAETLGGRDALGLGVIALPVVVILALPPTSLTSYAAGRRSSFTGAGFVSSAEDVRAGDLSLADVAGAVRSDEAMQALVSRAGEEVSFTGFVDRDGAMPADEFILTRFMVSCCVADALSVQVRVAGAPPGEFDKDQWVRVVGNMYPLGREVIVDASEIDKVDRPERPYLNP